MVDLEVECLGGIGDQVRDVGEDQRRLARRGRVADAGRSDRRAAAVADAGGEDHPEAEVVALGLTVRQ